jgi:hypothetical protein
LPAIPTSVPLTALSSIRILADTSMLVTSGLGTFRLDPSGAVLRTYPRAGLLALDPDSHSFWTVTQLGIQKVDIQTGAVVITIPRVSGFAPTALTVIGEPRAALSNTAAIPLTTDVGLIVLALLLATVALLRLR